MFTTITIIPQEDANAAAEENPLTDVTTWHAAFFGAPPALPLGNVGETPIQICYANTLRLV